MTTAGATERKSKSPQSSHGQFGFEGSQNGRFYTGVLHALGMYDEQLSAARQTVRQYPGRETVTSYLELAFAVNHPEIVERGRGWG